MKEIASLIGTAIRDADGSRTAEVAAGVRELVGAAPGVPRARSAPADRMREYAVVLLAAALVTFLATPVVRMVAIRFRMMAAPRDRDVHVIPTPRGGGVAMYLGVAAGGAGGHPAARPAAHLRAHSQTVRRPGRRRADLPARRARRPAGAWTRSPSSPARSPRPGVMVLLGVQLAFLFLPVADIGTISLGPDAGVPLTILLTVLTVNALNFIDGLDGLAAGVSAIAGAGLLRLQLPPGAGRLRRRRAARRR